MTGEFRLSPESLSGAAEEMARHTDDFCRAVEKLKSRVHGRESPWGKDESSSMFGSIYSECVEIGVEALDHVAALLGGTAIGLDQMSQNVHAADRANESAFRGIVD